MAEPNVLDEIENLGDDTSFVVYKKLIFYILRELKGNYVELRAIVESLKDQLIEAQRHILDLRAQNQDLRGANADLRKTVENLREQRIAVAAARSVREKIGDKGWTLLMVLAGGFCGAVASALVHWITTK